MRGLRRTTQTMAAALAVSAGAAAGQNSWFFDVAYSDPTGVINSLDDTAKVTLWVSFDPSYYAFYWSMLDIGAIDPNEAGVWSDNRALLTGPGSLDGTLDGMYVRQVRPSQLHFPEAGIFADTANPIAAWTATWHTTDLARRDVDLFTTTRWFLLYINENGEADEFSADLMEGSGKIRVVPGPASCAALALAGLLAVGRRIR